MRKQLIAIGVALIGLASAARAEVKQISVAAGGVL